MAETPTPQGEPSDAQVEVACAGFYNDLSGLTSWTRIAEVSPDLADRYRLGMRAALRAAGVVVEEPTAAQLLEAIYDPEEDGENDSVRFRLVVQQYERLKREGDNRG